MNLGPISKVFLKSFLVAHAWSLCLVILAGGCDRVPEIAVVELPSPNFEPREGNATVDTIVLHGTATASRKQALDALLNRQSRRSAHYVVDRAGTIYRLVPENMAAWHAGDSRMPDGRDAVNDFSLGIELVNRNDGKQQYTQEQIFALKALIDNIKSRWSIRYLVTHAQIGFPPGRKTDPAGFHMEWLRAGEQSGYP